MNTCACALLAGPAFELEPLKLLLGRDLGGQDLAFVSLAFATLVSGTAKGCRLSTVLSTLIRTLISFKLNDSHGLIIERSLAL